ncbi:MAG TPA: hypothetical protein PKL88_02250 [bacterium]|nr:hypothetical protein [bacterium]
MKTKSNMTENTFKLFINKGAKLFYVSREIPEDKIAKIFEENCPKGWWLWSEARFDDEQTNYVIKHFPKLYEEYKMKARIGYPYYGVIYYEK